jgi:lysylphosphatidylglycerol synthetase-like protein (DUF2156 family)
MKPDWKQLIRERMVSAEPGNDIPLEVVAELATHLEEIYDDARAKSPTDDAAITVTLQEVRDWHVLAADIRGAKSKEDSMNYRTKAILLSATAVLFGVGLVLLFLDRAAILQPVIWTGCMGLLICAVASEGNRLNLRTKSLWLPGFVSLTVASLFLFAEELLLVHDPSFYFTDRNWSQHLISGLPRWFYFAWLLAQVLCGALAAFLSRRGGGTRAARLLAAAFPALVMFAVCTIVIPVSAFFEHNEFIFRHPGRLWLGVFVWAVAPAITLLLGAAPFLKESALHEVKG